MRHIDRIDFSKPWKRVLPSPALIGMFCLIAFIGGPPSAFARDAQDWPILHHDIRAAIDPSVSRLEVTDRIELGRPPDPARPLRLLLHRDLEIESADLSGASPDANSTGSDGTNLMFEESEGFQPRHFWKRPDYERLDDFAVARELTIHPPAGGWPSEPHITLRYSGAVYDSLRAPKVAYSRGFETTSGLIDERGAYLGGATFWIPWSGEGLFRYRLRVVVPPGWEGVSQGRWAERQVATDGRVESLWVVDDPMNEAYLIAGPYVVREALHGDVTVYTFTYENTPEDLCQTYLDATGDYLDLYEDMIGPYPFDKFAMIENWWQTGFGMPSFTLLGNRVIRLPFIVHTSYGHEILHNWWGNGVFVDTDEGNWCEGLTTYLADYSYKARESEAAARDYRLSQLQSYLDYASSGERDFALRRFTERESAGTQAVGYGKTMMVFHMARHLIGEDAFFDGLRQFYKEHLFEEASWDDVVRAFEAASDRSLAAWFEQWIGRPGAPVLSAARVAGAGDDAGTTHGGGTSEKDESVGKDESAGAGIWIELRQDEPFFDLQVPIRYEAGGELRSRWVPLDAAVTRVRLEADSRWVAVDPDFELFRKLHRGEIPPALSQVLGVDSTVVVIGSRCTPDMAAALRELAAEWSRNHDQIVVDETDFTEPDGRGVWLFGEGEFSDGLFANTRAFGDAPVTLRSDAAAGGRTLVASFRDPDQPEIPWTVVLPADASVVEALGRKLPHYGRYSYLVFEGETNVDKGSWVVESSPLRLDLTEEKR